MKSHEGDRKPFPMHRRDDLISQLISIRKRYPSYHAFGEASMADLWSADDRKDAQMLVATDMKTSFVQNKGDGTFVISPLPAEAQEAPVYGMLARDLDRDGNLDLLLVGNDFGMEPFTGRHDALMGLSLKGNGKGGFNSLTIAQSGFYVPGDGKGLASIHSESGTDLYLATQNLDSLRVFRGRQLGKPRWISLMPEDSYADILYAGNRISHQEFYYGSGFLSQSSRKVRLEPGAISMFVTDFRGKKRQIVF